MQRLAGRHCGDHDGRGGACEVLAVAEWLSGSAEAGLGHVACSESKNLKKNDDGEALGMLSSHPYMPATTTTVVRRVRSDGIIVCVPIADAYADRRLHNSVRGAGSRSRLGHVETIEVLHGYGQNPPDSLLDS